MPNRKRKAKQRAAQPRAVPRRTIRGGGGYVDDLRNGWGRFQKWSKTAGKPWMNAGRAMANAIVPGTGRALKQMTNLLGLGAYVPVQGNSILASPVPAMHGMSDQGVRIMNHEFIRDVNSSVAFSLVALGLNPGLKCTFPWLSDIAASFQKWEPNGIVFYFKSTSATALNSTNTALGTVVGAVQYDVDEENPSDKTSIVNLSGSQSGQPCNDNMYPVECAVNMRLTRNLLIRRGTISDDLQKYDLGKFLLATVGSQAASVIGELHICYDITLKQPIQAGAEGNDLLMAHYTSTGADGTHPLGSVAPSEMIDGLGVTFSASASVIDTITINPGSGGNFLVQLYWYGTNVTIAYPVPTLTGCTYRNIYNAGGTGIAYSPQANVASVQGAQMNMCVTVADAAVGASIKLGVAGTIPTNSTVDIVVTAVNRTI